MNIVFTKLHQSFENTVKAINTLLCGRLSRNKPTKKPGHLLV